MLTISAITAEWKEQQNLSLLGLGSVHPLFFNGRPSAGLLVTSFN